MLYLHLSNDFRHHCCIECVYNEQKNLKFRHFPIACSSIQPTCNQYSCKTLILCWSGFIAHIYAKFQEILTVYNKTRPIILSIPPINYAKFTEIWNCKCNFRPNLRYFSYCTRQLGVKLYILLPFSEICYVRTDIMTHMIFAVTNACRNEPKPCRFGIFRSLPAQYS